MGSPATFSGAVFPGTYKVTVGGNSANGSSLPPQPQTVQAALVVSANTTGLTYDVRTHTVSGTVTQNGMVPTGGTCSSSPRGYVTLADAAQGYSFTFDIPCMGSPATFAGAVYPGTYKVTVAGNSANGSSLPAQAQAVQQMLAVSADVTGLAFDVRTHTVSGTVTQNGMVPTGGTCSSSPRGYVVLTDAAQGYRFTLDIPCMGAPATFSGAVFPGTYKVTVGGNSANGSSLPPQAQTVQPMLVVSADTAGLAYDVRTFTVSGTVTQNGTVPTGGTCTSSPRGYVALTDAAQGYSFSLPIPCMGSPATFSGAVYPGTYKVTVSGNSANGSSLPAQAQEVQAALTVAADASGLAYDVITRTVSGTVTQNGMVPTGGTCTSSPRGYVGFREVQRGYNFSLPIPCMGAPATFSGDVFPGVYEVSVSGNTANGSSLPGQAQRIIDRLAVP
ncbi:MAG: hypothetical protein JNK82_39700 [Myxococcaceae bacterium]|nr:hypothetical protein [Myxococcaceae bacterium]